MEINDVNPWTALGLEEPETEQTGGEPESGNEPEVAEPAGAGGNEPEVAEPDTDDDMDEDLDPEEPEEKPEPEQKKQPMSKEERAANAKRRRQKEIDDAVAAAVEKALAEERKKQKTREEAFFKAAKMKNAHNGNSDILSLEDGEAWAAADKLAKANANLKAGRLTAEDLQALVEDSPVFKAMQQKQLQQDQAAQEQNRQQHQKTVELELAEIRKMNPKIKGLSDIVQMETGKEFARLVSPPHNLSYLDAYRLANHEQLMQQAQQVAAAGARVAAGGKDHLKKTQSRGQGALEVPADVKENYRALMPGMTDEEIQKEYNRFMKGK